MPCGTLLMHRRTAIHLMKSILISRNQEGVHARNTKKPFDAVPKLGFIGLIFPAIAYSADPDWPNELPKEKAPLVFYDAELKEMIPSRATLSKNDELIIYSVCPAPAVRFSETSRKSRLQEDVNTLWSAFNIEGCREPVTHKYHLRFTRSKVTITTIGSDNETVTRTVITGPKEHFYLGLDLPVNSKRTLKFDEKTESLVPNDDSPSLHLSLNFQFQDVLGRLEGDWPVGISIKAMALASHHPLNSIGFGVGLRSRGLSDTSLGFLDSLGLFGGVFWVKEDGIEDGRVAKNTKTRRLFRFGVSYDLSTGLNWLDP